MAKKTNEPKDLSSYKKIHKVEQEKKNPFKPTKKKVIALIVVIALCLTAGGVYYYVQHKDDYSTTVSNGSKKVITGDVTITKQGYFEYLLDNSGAQKTVDDAYNKIVNKIITNKKYKSEIDAGVKEKKTTYASYSTSLEAYATALGYSSVSEFEKDSIIPEVKQELLKKKYFTDNYTSSIKKYKAAYIKAIAVSKESEALKIIKQATSEEAFDTLMKSSTYSENATDYGLVTTKTSTSTLNKKIKNKLSTFSNMSKDGVYKTVIKQSSSKYVVVYVYNADKTKNKSTYINAFTDLSDLDDDVKVHYFKEYKFTVKDPKLKKAIKEINEDYIID